MQVVDITPSGSARPRLAPRHRRSGSVLLIALALITMMFALAGLSVDWGRTLLVEAEIQRAVDAAARHGAAGLMKNRAQAIRNVELALEDNPVQGAAIAAGAVTITFYDYDAAADTLVEVDGSVANAIGVRVAMTGELGVETMFAGMFGVEHFDASASSVATIHKEMERLDVDAKSNPWLAGMPAGTISNQYNPEGDPDYAGDAGASPNQVGVPITAGESMAFDAVSGGAAFSNGQSLANADGFTGNIFNNRFANDRVKAQDLPKVDWNGDGRPDASMDWMTYYTDGHGVEHGKSDLVAPGTSLVGVFLGPNQPLPGNEPNALRFDTNNRRDFKSLSPDLNQPFFIGDGRNNDGEQQRFVVPAGATRLYLGVMDMYQWGNNTGGFTTAVKKYGAISTVR